jgi:hypothetical protein
MQTVSKLAKAACEMQRRQKLVVAVTGLCAYIVLMLTMDGATTHALWSSFQTFQHPHIEYRINPMKDIQIDGYRNLSRTKQRSLADVAKHMHDMDMDNNKPLLRNVVTQENVDHNWINLKNKRGISLIVTPIVIYDNNVSGIFKIGGKAVARNEPYIIKPLAHERLQVAKEEAKPLDKRVIVKDNPVASHDQPLIASISSPSNFTHTTMPAVWKEPSLIKSFQKDVLAYLHARATSGGALRLGVSGEENQHGGRPRPPGQQGSGPSVQLPATRHQALQATMLQKLVIAEANGTLNARYQGYDLQNMVSAHCLVYPSSVLTCLCSALPLFVSALPCLCSALSLICLVSVLPCLCSALTLFCLVSVLPCLCSALSLFCLVSALPCLCSALSLFCLVSALLRLCSALSLLCLVSALPCLCSALSLLCLVSALPRLCSALSLLCLNFLFSALSLPCILDE